MSVAFLRAKSRSTYPCSSQPNSNWRSILRRQKRWASPCRRRCWHAPTRCWNEPPACHCPVCLFANRLCATAARDGGIARRGDLVAPAESDPETQRRLGLFTRKLLELGCTEG